MNDEKKLCGVLCCDCLVPDERVPPTLEAPSFLLCDQPAGHNPVTPHSCSACRAQAARIAARIARESQNAP